MKVHDHAPVAVAKDGIDRYVHALSAAIPATGRAKRQFLREISDGLRDAADDLVDHGLDHSAAVQSAIAEFGSVSTIARECSIELLALAARRLAIVFAIVFPVVVSAWQVLQTLLPMTSAAPSTTERTGWLAFVDQAENVIPLIASVGAIAGALLLMRGPLRRDHSHIVALILGAWVLIGIVLTASGGAVLTVGSSGISGAGSPTPMLVASMFASDAIAVGVFVPIAISLHRLRRVCRTV